MADSNQPDSSPVSAVDEFGNLLMRLSDEQIAVLKEVTNARELYEMQQQPGWKTFRKIVEHKIHQIERQILDNRTPRSKDVLWVMVERYNGIRDLWESVMDGLAVADETLNDKEAIEIALTPMTIRPEDLPGDVY